MMLAVMWPFFDSEGSGLWEENRLVRSIWTIFASEVCIKARGPSDPKKAARIVDTGSMRYIIDARNGRRGCHMMSNGKCGIILHTELVAEISQEPDYSSALNAVKS